MSSLPLFMYFYLKVFVNIDILSTWSFYRNQINNVRKWLTQGMADKQVWMIYKEINKNDRLQVILCMY